MIAFYENLKDEQNKDEALTNAKNSFITCYPMKAHPFYWAGFIVNGNLEPQPIFLTIELDIGATIYRKIVFQVIGFLGNYCVVIWLHIYL